MIKVCSHCSHPVDGHVLRKDYAPSVIYVVVCARCAHECATTTLSEIVTSVLEGKSMVLS